MTTQELCAWLREHSSGVYRPAADAADLIERLLSAPASTGREPFAWESTTPIYTRFITDARYQKLRPAYQKWYRPICNKCAPIAARELDVEAERREFEADYTVNQQREGANSEYIFLSLQRRGDGEYSTTYVNGRWHGWLAARSAAPSPNNPPVGGNSD